MKKLVILFSFILGISTACSDKKDNTFKTSGIYQLENNDKSENKDLIFLRIESDKFTRYTINIETKTYAWETHSYLDGKLNGKVQLIEASCLSSNKERINSVQDFSKYRFKEMQDGFMLENNFFKKLSSHESEQLLGQLENYKYSCQEEGSPEEVTAQDLVQTTTKILNPKMLQSDELPPLIAGTVLRSKNNGADYYVIFSDKSYQTYLVLEDRVSWIYGELKDGKLTGRTVRLQNSCPEGHPNRATLGKTQNASNFEVTVDETDKKIVTIGENSYEKLNIDEWQKAYEQILKSKIVCNAIHHAER